MKKLQTFVIIALFIIFSNCDGKGMTWGVMKWPIPSNNNVGKVGCSGCDAYNGDTLCTEKRKILCLIGAYSEPRPWYDYGSQYSPWAIPDHGYYNGWTGGIYSATSPYPGTFLASRSVADSICKKNFG